ncbi:hypothetical protein COCCU_00950 [Corynebacterium occultum]|uniref:Beta-lactamase enzyme family protein n=1 Tax=Corynebacterium occultum TaxID=2675219 RepID=A0A6B8WI35_9CORY|nr:hypothetical protein [Corynebacterium occultum]QGU06158.1 hypothetical protein COCCU_00950 [Corynebacterium occultum]
MRKIAAALLSFTLALSAAPAAAAITLNPGAVPSRTQITLQIGGQQFSTPNSGESRPALSLSKLYLGHWVLHHGAPEDKAKVEHMIRVSDDGVASQLERTYPSAIPDTIAAFGLGQTRHNGYWGNTSTSSNDVARFVAETRNDPVSAPLFNGMATASPVAADGYAQDFGTARVAGVQGTKFGWSDDRNVHATVSYGPGFTIAANTYGTPAAHTADVLGAIIGAPVIPTSPGAPSSPGTRELYLGSTSIPAITGAELKAKVACQDPHNLRQVIPNELLVPTALSDAVPAC